MIKSEVTSESGGADQLQCVIINQMSVSRVKKAEFYNSIHLLV